MYVVHVTTEVMSFVTFDSVQFSSRLTPFSLGLVPKASIDVFLSLSKKIKNKKKIKEDKST